MDYEDEDAPPELVDTSAEGVDAQKGNTTSATPKVPITIVTGEA